MEISHRVNARHVKREQGLHQQAAGASGTPGPSPPSTRAGTPTAGLRWLPKPRPEASPGRRASRCNSEASESKALLFSLPPGHAPSLLQAERLPE